MAAFLPSSPTCQSIPLPSPTASPTAPNAQPRSSSSPPWEAVRATRKLCHAMASMDQGIHETLKHLTRSTTRMLYSQPSAQLKNVIATHVSLDYVYATRHRHPTKIRALLPRSVWFILEEAVKLRKTVKTFSTYNLYHLEKIETSASAGSVAPWLSLSGRQQPTFPVCTHHGDVAWGGLPERLPRVTQTQGGQLTTNHDQTRLRGIQGTEQKN